MWNRWLYQILLLLGPHITLELHSRVIWGPTNKVNLIQLAVPHTSVGWLLYPGTTINPLMFLHVLQLLWTAHYLANVTYKCIYVYIVTFMVFMWQFMSMFKFVQAFFLWSYLHSALKEYIWSLIRFKFNITINIETSTKFL